MIAPWYSIVYIQLERIAWRHGYCLAIHGSMARDVDLLAVPWTEDADRPDKLVKAICKFVVANSAVSMSIPAPTKKPHGRLAYSILVGHGGHYFDLSVMPLQNRDLDPEFFNPLT